MSIASVDQIISLITVDGKYFKAPFARATPAATVAGKWSEFFTSVGTGGTGVLTGSAGVGTAMSSSTLGSIPQPQTNVSPSTKYLLTFLTSQGVATSGVNVLLTDFLYIYPSCVVTGTPTTLSNAASKPSRFNNGIGVKASCIVASALGAAQPVLTTTYTNSDNTGSRTGNFAAAVNSEIIGSILGGGSQGTQSGYSMGLQAGDSGVKQLDSYTIASGTTGAVTFLLHRPIAAVVNTSPTAPGERDFLFQFPSLPIIPDDACLGLLVYSNTSLASGRFVYGEIGCMWD